MKHNNSDSQLAAALNKPGVMQTLPLAFVKWYSGMEEGKILKAYERWQKESGIVAVGQRSGDTVAARGHIHKWHKTSAKEMICYMCKETKITDAGSSYEWQS